MKVINKREIQTPTEKGWYVCKYVTSLIMRYEDQEKKLGRMTFATALRYCYIGTVIAG